MIWGKKQDTVKDESKWHNWFAWRPIQLVDHRWAWLEKIERRSTFCFDECFWIYRLPATRGV